MNSMLPDSEAPITGASSALTLDYDSYEQELAAFDLNKKQQRELLESLFHIIVSIVDHPCG